MGFSVLKILMSIFLKFKPKSKRSATGNSKSKSGIKSLTIYSAAGLLCLRHFLQQRKQDVRRLKKILKQTKMDRLALEGRDELGVLESLKIK
jgi:hypothetical protein